MDLLYRPETKQECLNYILFCSTEAQEVDQHWKWMFGIQNGKMQLYAQSKWGEPLDPAIINLVSLLESNEFPEELEQEFEEYIRCFFGLT